MFVFRMTPDVVPNPCCWSDKFASGAFLDEIKILRELLKTCSVGGDVIQISSYEGDEAREVITLSAHDLFHRHFFVCILLVTSWCRRGCTALVAYTFTVHLGKAGRGTVHFAICSARKHGNISHTISIISFLERGKVASEKELPPGCSVPAVCSLHISIYTTDRNIKVEIEGKNRPLQENDEHRKCSIFEIGELHFHASEFCPPPDVGIVRRVPRRRRLPPYRLPVRTLDTLEMFCLRFVVYLLDCTVENNEWIANEQVC
mmetsp:Transcript_3119/g.7094  ORF Transcript_3119/g.7094 Transcript_3119/m.7094 type:complete len:260 (-) Transcript_3119:2251-3030(-)